MRIKSVLALSLLSAATGYSVAVQAESSTNFLAGIEGAYARQKQDFSTLYTDPSLTPVAITDINQQAYMMDDPLLMAGGILGWQWRCNRFLLGLEANADLHSLNKARAFVYNGGTSPSVFEGTMEYDRGPIYNFTMRAGYFVTPSMMPYVRGGAQFSRDEATYQVFTNIAVSGVGAAQQADFISSGKKDIWGYVLGIGLEFPALLGPSTIRVEYLYSRTESISIGDGIPPIFATDRFEHPQTNAIKFAWVWNFICDKNKKSTSSDSSTSSDISTSSDSSTSDESSTSHKK